MNEGVDGSIANKIYSLSYGLRIGLIKDVFAVSSPGQVRSMWKRITAIDRYVHSTSSRILYSTAF